jgi:hypothetical protein
VYTGEVAGLRGFPDHQHRGLVEVHGGSPFLDDNRLQLVCQAQRIETTAGYSTVLAAFGPRWGFWRNQLGHASIQGTT